MAHTGFEVRPLHRERFSSLKATCFNRVLKKGAMPPFISPKLALSKNVSLRETAARNAFFADGKHFSTTC
jgi:hypothetical protein